MSSDEDVFSTSAEFSCRKCGKPRDLWGDHGYRDGERHYCCKGCATGFWCLCLSARDQAISVEAGGYRGPERRLAPPRRAWKQERRAMFLKNPN
jgi:hypothetical protein